MHASTRTRRTRAASIAIAAVALLAPLFTAVPANAATAGPDGLTQETAAGSCWEIKQKTPAAPDGVYWLVTPMMRASGTIALTATAIPAARPPPDSGISTVRSDGISVAISTPMVPWPATTSG